MSARSAPASPPARHAVIAGAGLSGALLAIYLARDGWRVSVYERRPDPRAAGYAGGRSINLALSARGLDALAGVGLDEHVRARDAIAMPGRMIHPLVAPGRAGDVVFQPYSVDPRDAINSVSRGGLNLTLIEAAASEPGVSLHFDRRCIDADLSRPSAMFVATDNSEFEEVEADLLIACDGAFSAVRLKMLQTDRFEYRQSYLQHGYKELHFPPKATAGDPGVWPVNRGGGGGAEPSSRAPLDHDLFPLEPHALHIWPRGSSMMIALPNRDGSFTGTLFWPYEAIEALRTPEAVLAHFREAYPDAVPLMPTLADDFLRNPVGSLVTVRCHPWQLGGKVALVGDAAHAIVPFYGQGMNAAFEDCKHLAACLREHPRDQRAALEQYQRARKPAADAIADMALENFVEMRDKTGRPEFLYSKKVEQALHQMFPARVHPQYNLVSFSTVPYDEAQREGRRLARVLERVVATVPPGGALVPGSLPWLDAVRTHGDAALAAEGL